MVEESDTIELCVSMWLSSLHLWIILKMDKQKILEANVI